MDATNLDTSTDTVGIGYHRQGHPAHQRTITPMADDHCTLDTRQVDMMTEEAGYTRETEVQAAQDTPAQTDMPAGTETQDGDTRLTTTGLSNNRPPTPYTRHNSRSRSSSHNNEKPHRCSVTIQDNPSQ